MMKVGEFILARTQAADYEDKRRLITQRAAQLFAEKGFAAASIADLAEACDVSKSLIYHYYSAKEAILFDIMNEHVDELLEELNTAISADGKPEENLIALTRGLLSRYVGAAGRQKVLLYELGSLPSDQKKEIIRKQRALMSGVEKVLQAIDREQAHSVAVIRAKVMLYFGMLNWTDNWFRPRGAISRDEVADMIATTTIQSL